MPVRHFRRTAGLGTHALTAAIEAWSVKAMIIDGSIAGRDRMHRSRTRRRARQARVPGRDRLVQLAAGAKADIVLPEGDALEKDGTFTSFDRTVQRVRAAVPPMGESKAGT